MFILVVEKGFAHASTIPSKIRMLRFEQDFIRKLQSNENSTEYDNETSSQSNLTKIDD